MTQSKPDTPTQPAAAADTELVHCKATFVEDGRIDVMLSASDRFAWFVAPTPRQAIEQLKVQLAAIDSAALEDPRVAFNLACFESALDPASFQDEAAVIFRVPTAA